MSYKVYAKGNYFIIENANGVFKEDHKINVRVAKRLVSDTTYIINMKGGSEVYELADLTDESGAAYTQNSWETFAFSNSGFSSASGGSGAGTTITVVSSYSTLPSATSNSGNFYWVSNSQGTKWLPATLGGTYYPNGMYYSNGTSWEYVITPYQATLSEVDTGTNTDKFVTPSTFTNASKWTNYLDKATYDIDNDGIVDSAKKEIVQFINKSGATITKGTIVYLKTSSSSASYPEVVKANAVTESTSSKTIGAVFEDVLNDGIGYIVTSGEVRNIDTSAYVIGDKLWLSTTDGLVTTTPPIQPNHTVFIGTVTRSQTVNGRILYAIQNGYELDELHNVLISDVQNNDLIQYDSATLLWKNKQPIVYASPNETYRGISINHNTTTVVVDGGITMSSSASTTAQSVASTNLATKQIRLRYSATVVSGGRYTGTRGSALLWYLHGGFRYVCDFNISDTSYSAGCQQFYGMAGQTTDLVYGGVSGTLVSTLTNIVGVGSENGDTNLQVFHNDATGTATKIDLGVNFPANRTVGAISTTVYSIELYNEPMSTNVKYKVTNNETGAIANGTISTNLPLTSQGLNFFASRCMSTTSVTSTGQFDLMKLGVYSQL
jgi:hypothetical protein